MPETVLAPVYTTHADSVPSPMLWLYACVNVLVTASILCSKKTSLSPANMRRAAAVRAVRSILCNQAQTAKEASREKISGVQATSVTKKSYSTTLVDDHCPLSSSTEAPDIVEFQSRRCRSFATSSSI